MTVKELIQRLEKENPELDVYMNIGNNYVEVTNVTLDEDVGVLIDYGLDE